MLTLSVASRIAESGQRLVVTGAGGWIGRATLDLLQSALGDQFADRVICFGSSARTLDIDGTQVEQRPLDALPSLGPAPTLLLHLAFLTKDRAEAMDEAEFRAANAKISGTVLDSLDGIGAEAVFVASSGAAAFADDPTASPAMRLYGSLKREDEQAFADWAERTGRRAVIARIFNISGPHINKQRSYALASFILDALAGGPVEVRADREVVRAYVAIRELMSLVFAMMLDGRSGATRFDSGGKPMEMREIAQTVADLAGCTVERLPLKDGPCDSYVGHDAAYRRLLALHGIENVPFPQQVMETAQFLSGHRAESGWPGGSARGSAKSRQDSILGGSAPSQPEAESRGDGDPCRAGNG